jgi:hypothetical protein
MPMAWRLVESGIVGVFSAAIPIVVLCIIRARRKSQARGFRVIEKCD